MPRLARYLLLWICCTAFAVTAVFFAVGFVVDSTTGVPPTVRTAADGIGAAVSGTADPAASAAAPTASAGAAGTPAASAATSPGAGAATSAKPRPAATPSQQPSTGQDTEHPTSCQGGPGAYTVKSTGGQVSVRYGANAVCLISALPAPGFTTQTAQSDPHTLVVTFTSADHRSQITSTVVPRAQSSVRETAL
ncbi:hypothetical protein [Kitasatospora paracochleata]|uniref:DUF4232 domain-containing protein n=2 Tax=Kitasatospora paracochleata TaxID=58354 RepID=A0ABT1J8E4_9ACTN|nr:hypothetical protein [Kitasatospora paracochleata]MCP2313703.1 hypothetical protein [Kitasatospora paracochleata]